MNVKELFLFALLALLCRNSAAGNDCNSIKDQRRGWPAIGSLILSDGGNCYGDFEDYRFITKFESRIYQIFELKTTGPFAQRYYFSMVKKVPRPDTIPVNDAYKYYYYEILYSGYTFQDVNFCDTNAISHIDLDDSNAYLITAILSPGLKVDTLLTVDKRNWKRSVFDEDTKVRTTLPFQGDTIVLTLDQIDDTSAYLISSNGMKADTMLYRGPSDLLTPEFNYKLSLPDSVLAVGLNNFGNPQVNIYKIESGNKRTKIRTISNGYELSMSYDYRQIFIEQQFEDCSLYDSIRGTIKIYDISMDRWSTLRSSESSYTSPTRIFSDGYIYFVSSGKRHTSLCRSMDGGSVEMIYGPVYRPRYIWLYMLSIDGSLSICIQTKEKGLDGTSKTRWVDMNVFDL